MFNSFRPRGAGEVTGVIGNCGGGGKLIVTAVAIALASLSKGSSKVDGVLFFCQTSENELLR